MRGLVAVSIAATLWACGTDDGGDPPDDVGKHEPGRIEMTWEPVTLQPGEEQPWLCASWTLDNDEPLYVHSVEMTSGQGWHHSNWLFVPADTVGVGPDGVWPCDERAFDPVAAGLVGGVLFAQSTQVSHEVQQFQPGAAIVVPPRSRIVGQLHLLNASDAPLTTSVQLTAQTLPPDDVEIRLAPLALQFMPLAIPPMSRARFTTSCDLGRSEFRVYYVLPHYHELGEDMTIEAYAAGDTRPLLQSDTRVGEPLGRVLDPPFDMTGAGGIRFSCTYLNAADRTVRYGNGDGEMCVLLAYTDDYARWGGGALLGPTRQVGVDPDGTLQFEAGCTVLDFPL